MRYDNSRRRPFAALATIIVCIAGGLVGCRHKARIVIPIIPPITAADEGIALSLRSLIQRAHAEAERGEISEVTNFLGGMTEVDGYVIDTKNRDVVLIGRAKTGAPHLYLCDFIAALRSAFGAYDEEKGGVQYHLAPGVSIDPNPETLMELGRIQRQTFQNTNPAAINDGLKEWTNVAQGPQNTRILGMPHVRMMGVALDGDYTMKHIVDGTISITGITSLTELHEKSARNAASNPLNRFWIVSWPDPTFVEDDGVVLFKSFPIGLKTEAEVLVNRNTIAETGKADPMATKFCSSFGKHYDDELAKQTVYADLRNGFRWIGLATLMQRKAVFEQSGLSNDFLLKECEPATVNIPETLPGVANIKPKKTVTSFGESYQWLMSVGGVDMTVNTANIRTDASGSARTISSVVLAARPSAPALWWRFRTAAISLSPPL